MGTNSRFCMAEAPLTLSIPSIGRWTLWTVANSCLVEDSHRWKIGSFRRNAHNLPHCSHAGWGGVGVMMITFTRSCTRCCLQWGGVGWGGAMIMLTRPCTRLWCCAQDDLSYFRVGWDECILQQFARILLEDDFTVVLVAHSWVFSDGQCWVDFLSPFLFFSLNVSVNQTTLK